jgi:hypothetical protein
MILRSWKPFRPAKANIGLLSDDGVSVTTSQAKWWRFITAASAERTRIETLTTTPDAETTLGAADKSAWAT